jgi:hypothetical protein
MWLRVLEVDSIPGLSLENPTPADKPPGLVNGKSTFPQISSDFYQGAKNPFPSTADTLQLLRSPTFHRAVQHVHKKFHEIRYGKDPAEMGGTKIDSQSVLRVRHEKYG